MRLVLAIPILAIFLAGCLHGPVICSLTSEPVYSSEFRQCVHENSPSGVNKEWYCLMAYADRDNNTEFYMRTYNLYSDRAKAHVNNSFEGLRWQIPYNGTNFSFSEIVVPLLGNRPEFLTQFEAGSEEKYGNLVVVGLTHPFIQRAELCGREFFPVSAFAILENGEWKVADSREANEIINQNLNSR